MAKNDEKKTPTDSDLRSQAYNKATRDLRAKHREEFTAMVTAEAEALGVTYRPRLTAEEKAERKLAALMEEHPHLQEKIKEMASAEA